MNAPRHLAWDWYPDPLPENAHLGERSWVWSSFAFLHHRSTRPDAIRIGADSGIYDGTFLETGIDAQVEIGDFSALVGPVLSTNSRIVIGDYVFVSHKVALAETFAAVPPHAATQSPAQGSGEIVVGDMAWIGVGATVLGGSHIGVGAIVGALSVVDFDVPPYAVVAGTPHA